MVRYSNPSNQRFIALAGTTYSLFVVLGFTMLYIWPFNLQNAKNFSAHLIFNSILSIDFVFKLPLALSFLFGIFATANVKKVFYYMGLTLAIGMSSNILYGTLNGRSELRVNHIELEFDNLPKSFDGFKILQISDVHLGSLLGSDKVLNKVEKETLKIKPELILFTGDMFNNYSHELQGQEILFQRITQNSQSFSILGNHDYGNYSSWDNPDEKQKNMEQILKGVELCGFKLLNNESTVITAGEDSIYLTGVENWGHPPFPQYANLEKAMNGVPSKQFNILMTHDPAHWDEVVKNNGDIELTLSGHTHGMQWGIKRAGITFSLSYLTRRNWGGLYQHKSSLLYVNAGLGVVGMPWRINMPAELTVIILKRSEVN